MKVKIESDCKICILGDSLVEHDGWVSYLRALFAEQGVQVFNRGIGGNRVRMARALLADEIFWLQPTYTFICYGVNDLGIWLYDGRLTETDELLQKREERVEEYRNGLRETARAIKERGIVPVLFSPVPVNENMPSVATVQTHGDNQEKDALITAGFYTRESMENVNAALEGLTEIAKTLAAEEGYLFFDLFHSVKLQLLKKTECYRADGIHLTEKGHWIVARSVLPFFGLNQSNTPPNISLLHQKIKRLNEKERAVQLFRWGFYHPILGSYSEAQIVAEVERISLDGGSEPWLRETAEIFLSNRSDLAQIREELVRLHRLLVNENKKDSFRR